MHITTVVDDLGLAARVITLVAHFNLQIDLLMLIEQALRAFPAIIALIFLIA